MKNKLMLAVLASAIVFPPAKALSLSDVTTKLHSLKDAVVENKGKVICGVAVVAAALLYRKYGKDICEKFKSLTSKSSEADKKNAEDAKNPTK